MLIGVSYSRQIKEGLADLLGGRRRRDVEAGVELRMRPCFLLRIPLTRSRSHFREMARVCSPIWKTLRRFNTWRPLLDNEGLREGRPGFGLGREPLSTNTCSIHLSPSLLFDPMRGPARDPLLFAAFERLSSG